MPAGLLLQKFLATGMPAGAIGAFGDIADSQTAAGSTQATAHETSTAVVRYSTVTAGAGSLLDNGSRGDSQVIINEGANDLLVYPHVGGTIGQLSANAAMTLITGHSAVFDRVTSTRWAVTAVIENSGGIGGSLSVAALNILEDIQDTAGITT